MEIDPAFLRVDHRGVYELDEVGTRISEALPDLWEALEAFTSSDINSRRAGLDRLITLDVIHQSPMVAYILATRLDEPDLSLRTRVVMVLGDLLQPSTNGSNQVAQVKLQLSAYIAHMRTRRIFALLQVADANPSTHESICRILNHCPFGGVQLGDLIADRSISLSIRKLAVDFIAEVGYLDALPSLERQFARLERRMNGHQIDTLTEEDGDIWLLPSIQQAMQVLRTP
jgi:hypothetical protein